MCTEGSFSFSGPEPLESTSVELRQLALCYSIMLNLLATEKSKSRSHVKLPFCRRTQKAICKENLAAYQMSLRVFFHAPLQIIIYL